MADESKDAVCRVAELRVMELKAELLKRNLDTRGNKSALVDRLRQTIEEERGNPDEISITSEVPSNKTPKRMGKGHTVEDDETEDCREEDFGERQETDALPEGAGVVEEKENIAESLGEAYSSVPTETPPEDLRLLTQYMIITDTYQEDDNALAELQVEDMLTLDVDNGIPLDTSLQPVREQMDIEKMDTRMFVTGNSSEMENNQEEHEVQVKANIESTEKEPQPGTEQNKDETMKPEDEGSDEATKKDPSMVEGSDQNKSSFEVGTDTNNEANLEKGLSGNHSTSDTEGKNLLVSGLCSTTEVTCLKNLFSKYGKVLSANVVTNTCNPGARCSAFITMSTGEEATQSINSLNQSELSGQTITVELAKSEPGHKSTEEKGRNVRDSKSSCSPRADSDRGQSGDKGYTVPCPAHKAHRCPGEDAALFSAPHCKKLAPKSPWIVSGSSVVGKSEDRNNSRGDSKKRENDRKDRRRGKDEHRYRPSHSRSRSSERRRRSGERIQSSERRRSSRERSRSSERRRRRSRERSRSSERRRRRSREKSRSSERRRRSRSSERRKRSRSSERRRRSRSSERRRRRSRERSRSSERRKSTEKRRSSRSRSRHRRSPSRDKRRDVSTEKTHELTGQPLQLDPKEALWAIERRREREIWEEEASEVLERDLERLQLERMRLERERLDETAQKRQRVLLEEETRQEQERAYREREELLQKMCYEQTVKRPFIDVGARGAWERETRQEWETGEMLKRELDQVRYERIRLERERLEQEAQERPQFLPDGDTGKEQEQNYREREEILYKMHCEQTLKRPDIGYSRDWNSDPSWKTEGFPDHSWQGTRDGRMMGRDLTPAAALQRSLGGLYRMELAEAQRTDPSLEAVRYQAMHPNNKTDIDMGSTFLYKEGILVRRWSPKEGFFKESEVFEEIVVPELYRGEILKLAHNIPSTGHQGVKRTGRRVLQYFYWPSVFMDVARYCKACEKCQYLHKLGDVSNLGLRSLPTINIPFKRVSIDVVGPLPFTTNSGKRYILMVVDCASRYPDATALASVEADIVAMALLLMFTRVGFPEEILSNQGANFMSQLVMQLRRQCQDKQLRSTPYHPQVNGLVERFNGTLKQVLRTYAEQNPYDWDEKLQYFLFACREVPQKLTGFSPFELLYGRRVRGTLFLIKEAWSGKCFGEDKNVVEHVLKARDDLIALTEHIQEDQDHSQNGRNLWYCHNAGTREYEIGQRVLVLLPVKRQKVQLHWEGPYTVVETGKYVHYAVAIPFNKFRIYHVNMLKPYLDC
ncbi:scaffold attachment factor B1-like isoform X2 [Heptranchias perlo]|uniref:scaffold attachment factor B1-like isoform X2 n=1 Tax=Heptranchias perlo TaxID=212740 RepID=UPI00355A18E5